MSINGLAAKRIFHLPVFSSMADIKKSGASAPDISKSMEDALSIKERMKVIEDSNKQAVENRKNLVEQLGGINRQIAEIDALLQRQVGAYNTLKELLDEVEKPVEVPAPETEH
jgi:hypothetical protein